jgi:hypothetical protein
MMTYGAEALYLAGPKVDPATYTDMTAKGIFWFVGYTILTEPGIDMAALQRAEEIDGRYFLNCLKDMLTFDYARIAMEDDSPHYYPTAKLRAQYPNLSGYQVVEDDGEWIDYDGVF